MALLLSAEGILLPVSCLPLVVQNDAVFVLHNCLFFKHWSYREIFSSKTTSGFFGFAGVTPEFVYQCLIQTVFENSKRNFKILEFVSRFFADLWPIFTESFLKTLPKPHNLTLEKCQEINKITNLTAFDTWSKGFSCIEEFLAHLQWGFSQGHEKITSAWMKKDDFLAVLLIAVSLLSITDFLFY